MITAEQKKLVQGTWAKITPISANAATLFYNKLFELDPSLRPLFTTDITDQGQKLMQTITVVVKGLIHLDELLPAVEELGRRHLGYGVKDEHYGTVATALIWTLETSLGPSFTPEVKDAWGITYTMLADTMRRGAQTA